MRMTGQMGQHTANIETIIVWARLAIKNKVGCSSHEELTVGPMAYGI